MTHLSCEQMVVQPYLSCEQMVVQLACTQDKTGCTQD